MYYDAVVAARNNNHTFHIAAYTKIGNSYVVGINSNRSSTKFLRKYPDGTISGHLHAEMDLLRQLKNIPSHITVVRVNKNGELTMAKPCKYCQHFLKLYGVRSVTFTNWSGEFETLYL